MTQAETDATCALDQLLAFKLDGQRCGLHLTAVTRIVRMVEVTPLPGVPEIVIGLINWQGTIIPVLNVRKRFGFREQEPSWNDHLIIARTSTRTVSIAVDSVTGVIERSSDQITSSQSIVPEVEYVAGVIKVDGDLLFIFDLDRFLSPGEEINLDEAMAGK